MQGMYEEVYVRRNNARVKASWCMLGADDIVLCGGTKDEVDQ